MTHWRLHALATTLCLISVQIYALPHSRAARAAFQHTHPCPANGHKRGSCPGYVVDHVIPLVCGGPDHPSNMQWQTTADGKAKDKIERKSCGKI